MVDRLFEVLGAIFLDATGVFLPVVVGALSAVERLLLGVLLAALEAAGLLLVLEAGFGLVDFLVPAFGAPAGLLDCFPVVFVTAFEVAVFLVSDAGAAFAVVVFFALVLVAASEATAFVAVDFFAGVFEIASDVAVFLAGDFGAVFLAVDFLTRVFDAVTGIAAGLEADMGAVFVAVAFFTRVFEVGLEATTCSSSNPGIGTIAALGAADFLA